MKIDFLKKVIKRFRIFIRNLYINKNINLREIKKYLIYINDNFRINYKEKQLEKIFYKIIFILKIVIIIIKNIIYVI